MRNIKKRSLFAVLISMIMIMSMGISAFADQTKTDGGAYTAGPDTDVQAALTKTLIMGKGTKTPAVENRFRFTAVTDERADVGPNGAAINGMKSGHATIDTITLTIAEGTEVNGNANGSDVVELQSGNFLEGVSFAAPGTYVYSVTEISSTLKSQKGADVKEENLEKSNAEYLMYLTVSNKSTGTGTFIEYIGVKQVAKNGTPGSEGWDHSEDEKVDPTPYTVDPTEAEYDYTKNSDMRFVNSFTRVMEEDVTDPETKAAQISKKVAGTEAADKLGTYFNFSVKITKPAAAADSVESYKAYVVENGAKVTALESNGVSAAGDGAITFTSGTAMDVKLKNGQKLVFEDATVGAKLESEETGYDSSWQPDTKVTEDGAEISPVSAAAGSLEAGQTGINLIETTNRFKDDTPTGILLNNMPFFLILIAALGAVAVFTVVKGRRRAEMM